MKLTLTVRHGSKVHEHHLELNLPKAAAGKQGTVPFTLGAEKGEMDWAEVAPGVYSILIGGRSYAAQVVAPPPVRGAGDASCLVTVGTLDFQISVHDPRRRRGAGSLAAGDGPQEIHAPMPGKIVRILISRDQEVVAGEGLLVIEAMKMQNELRAPRAGRVEEIYTEEGKGVETGARLLRLA
jgi:biotin carboxyl carrier protein